MQTSELEVLRWKFIALVKGPVTSLAELVRAGHLDAAGIFAERVVPQMEEFADELAKLVPPPEPPKVEAPVPEAPAVAVP